MPSTRNASSFDARVAEATGGPLTAERISTVQVNIGLKCNLTCEHCHVSSSPRRTEQMSWETMEDVLRVAGEAGASMIDITGGAPEMNPHFRRLVERARAAGHEVMVRTNLTILLDDGYTDLPQFFRDHGVHLIASLPCYTMENVDRQRGAGVYDGSVEAMKRLNTLGYGIDPALPLDLVYNPGGPSLPGGQAALEADYRRELRERHGLSFTRLYTLANMPIGRFATDLKSGDGLPTYRALLEHAFNPATVAPLMCRHQISVDWNGTLYDCDFNLALRLPVGGRTPRTIRDFDAGMHTRRIVTGEHCFGCTAGSGSSCGGALVTA